MLKDNNLKGAILFGENKATKFVNKNLNKEVEESEVREAINLYKWKCSNCGAVYDEAVMELLFKNLSDDWKCPECNAPKNKFIKQVYEE